MKARLVGLAALMCACGTGSGGTPPPSPADSGTGLLDSGTGGSGNVQPSWVTVDAAGTLVSAGNGFVYWDAARGIAWHLNPETGLPSMDAAPTYYASADCSGVGYATAYSPRVAFKARGETAWRLRPDTMKTVLVTMKSWVYTSGCQPLSGLIACIPLDASTLPSPALTLPPAFVPPLHQELR